MPYIIFLALLFTTSSGIFSLYRQLQILQQNSFSWSEYIKWLKTSYTIDLAISAIVYCVMTVSMLKGRWIFSFVVAIVLLGLRVFLNINAYRKSEKRLNFTAKVKGIYIVAILVLGILLLLSVLMPRGFGAEVCRTLCMALSTVSPLLTLLASGLLWPIEKIINR